MADTQSVLFLGRHVGYPIALEGALKLKEISYIHAEGFAAGELKHGPIALIEPGQPVFVIVPSPRESAELHKKVVSNIQEIRARGARVIVVAEEGDAAVLPFADEVLRIPLAGRCSSRCSRSCRCTSSRWASRPRRASTSTSRATSRSPSPSSSPRRRRAASRRGRIPCRDPLRAGFERGGFSRGIGQAGHGDQVGAEADGGAGDAASTTPSPSRTGEDAVIIGGVDRRSRASAFAALDRHRGGERAVGPARLRADRRDGGDGRRARHRRLHLSLSHDAGLATAYVIAESQESA
jgi:hypothetical protein